MSVWSQDGEPEQVLMNKEMAEWLIRVWEYIEIQQEINNLVGSALQGLHEITQINSKTVGSLISSAGEMMDIELKQLEALDTMLVEIERQQQSLFWLKLWRTILMPFTLFSVGVAITKLWDNYELGKKVKNWFRGKFGN